MKKLNRNLSKLDSQEPPGFNNGAGIAISQRLPFNAAHHRRPRWLGTATIRAKTALEKIADGSHLQANITVIVVTTGDQQ
jgi:N-acetylglucosamine-6-phosphate deacetylase